MYNVYIKNKYTINICTFNYKIVNMILWEGNVVIWSEI